MRALDLLLIVVFIITSLIAHFVAAESWNVVQSMTLENADLDLKQSNNTANSVQAGNAIVVDGMIAYAEQNLEAANRHIRLTQDSGSNQNFQALNVIQAGTVKNAKQQLQAANSVHFRQENGVSSGNTQAVNKILEQTTSSQINSVEQSVQTQMLSFSQNAGGMNRQVANLLESEALITGNINQRLNADTVSFQQSNGSVNNLQAVNAVISNGLSGTVTQSTAATVTTVSGIGNDQHGIRVFNYIKDSR